MQPSPGAVAVLLTAWGNTYGTALLREAKATQPDLLAIESCLNVTFAQRALDGARATGSGLVLDYVRDTIDLENATVGLMLAGGEADLPGKRAFVEGGRRLTRAAFLEAIAAGDTAAAGRHWREHSDRRHWRPRSSAQAMRRLSRSSCYAAASR
jgi:hypothetical protein